MKDKQSLALCMICRNGENQLGQAIKSAREFVDEIVFLDTGSTDKSIEIAKDLGAIVISTEWTGSFSDARNFALDNVKSNWVLTLDCDEILDGNTFPARFSDRVAYLAQVANFLPKETPVLNGGLLQIDSFGRVYFESSAVRLFPQNPNIRFNGTVHESVEKSLNNLGIQIDNNNNIRILHFNDRVSIDQRANSYATFASKGLQRDPNDWLCRRTLGLALIEQGNIDEAYSHLMACNNSQPGDSHIVFGLAYVYAEKHKYHEAMSIVRSASHQNNEFVRWARIKILCLLDELDIASRETKLLCDSLPQCPSVWLQRILISNQINASEDVIYAMDVLKSLIGNRVEWQQLIPFFDSNDFICGRK